jgi:hypothetical protein
MPKMPFIGVRNRGSWPPEPRLGAVGRRLLARLPEVGLVRRRSVISRPRRAPRDGGVAGGTECSSPRPSGSARVSICWMRCWRARAGARGVAQSPASTRGLKLGRNGAALEAESRQKAWLTKVRRPAIAAQDNVAWLSRSRDNGLRSRGSPLDVFSASSPRSALADIMKRSNSGDRLRALACSSLGAVPPQAAVARPARSQVRTRPGRARSGDTLDARPFIVDACIRHQTCGIEKRLPPSRKRQSWPQ